MGISINICNICMKAYCEEDCCHAQKINIYNEPDLDDSDPNQKEYHEINTFVYENFGRYISRRAMHEWTPFWSAVDFVIKNRNDIELCNDKLKYINSLMY
jgi:hypothetical protein